MEERAAFKKGIRHGLKDEGFKKGGSVTSAASNMGKVKTAKDRRRVVHQSVLIRRCNARLNQRKDSVTWLHYV
jgi:2-methylisocitrate lyase-like PEP mutase family enzyme